MSDQFAAALRGAAPYINAHRERICVVHIPGEAAFERDLAPLIYDLAVAHSLGLRLVLVVGSRPQIEQRAAVRGVAVKMAGAYRVTDAAALDCAKDAAGSLRCEIEALLSTALASTPLGGARIRVAGGNLITARPVGVRDGVDLQFTGEVRRVDTETLREHLTAGRIVVLPALGCSPTGEIFNLRSEEVAVAVARQLNAQKLVCFSCQELQCGEYSVDDAASAFADQPWAEMVLDATRGGVARAHVLSADDNGAFLRELYTRDGRGILITGEDYDSFREAGIDDVGGLLRLIAPLEADGVLAPRSREQLELEIESFTVMQRDGAIIGCCALFPHGDAAELACFVIDPAYQRSGRAARLLRHVELRARAEGQLKLFVLTTHAAHWFVEHGFSSAGIDELPDDRASYYNYQRNSQVLAKCLG